MNIHESETFPVDYPTAIAKRKLLLTKCLVTVPPHAEHIEGYIHSGHIQEAKYRQPWNRVTADDRFLKQSYSEARKEAECLVTGSELEGLFLEDFNSVSATEYGNASVSNTINFDLSFDLPSSNPSSPESDVDPTNKSFTSVVCEQFQKEPLESLSHLDKNTLDEIVPDTETGVSSHDSVSNLAHLLSGLERLQTKDPFNHTDGSPVQEASLFGDSSIFCSNTDKPCEVIDMAADACGQKEEFVKQELNKTTKAVLDEMLIDDHPIMNCDLSTRPLELLKSMVQFGNVCKYNTVSDVQQLVTESSVNTGQVEKWKSFESGKHIQKDDMLPISFLDINEVIKTEVDEFCAKALLNSPLAPNQSSGKNSTSLTLCEREALPDNSEQISLLDDNQQRVFTEKYFSMERYCDDVQAARLAEPVIDVTGAQGNEREDSIIMAWQCLHIVQDIHVGLSELELRWVVSRDSVAADLSNKKQCLEMIHCQERAGALNPVEEFKKCALSEMNGAEEVLQEEPVNQEIHVTESGEEIRKCADTPTAEYKPKPVKIKNTAIEATGKQPGGQAFATDFDPLGQFMALRSVAVKNVCSQAKISQEEERKKSDPINQESMEPTEAIVETALDVPPRPKPITDTRRKKIKHHVVDIKLTVEFQDLLRLLEAKSEAYIKRLKISGDISANTSFKSLTPDISQFLIKQRRKYLEDSQIDVMKDDAYRGLVCLYGLVGAADCLMSYCMESAIAFLAALQDKYKHLLKNSLEGLRQQLFELKAQFSQRQILHPKVSALCREVETWLRKKKAKCHDNEQKILILVRRNLPSLLMCLKTALSTGHLLSPDILTSSSATQVIENLDAHNCLIGHEPLIQADFPWSQFSLVVEYEHQKVSPWQQLCARQQIRHFALNMVADESVNFELQNIIEKPAESLEQPVYVVASHKITEQTKLLQFLEARHNILLVERDYRLLQHQHRLYFPDMDVDECTCVMVEWSDLLVEDGLVQALVTKVVALSLKYSQVWLLLYPDTNQGYQFTGHAINNLSRLQAAICNFMVKKQHFKAKVVLCEDLIHVARTIYDIVNTRLSRCPPESRADWQDRSWLTGEITLEEKILLTLSMISSFNAQKLVARVGLHKSLSSTSEELMSYFPNLSPHVIKSLTYLTTSSHGLHLKSEDIIMDNPSPNEDKIVAEPDVEEFSTGSRSTKDITAKYRQASVVEDYQSDPSEATQIVRTENRDIDQHYSATQNTEAAHAEFGEQQRRFNAKHKVQHDQAEPRHKAWDDLDTFVASSHTTITDENQTVFRSCRDADVSRSYVKPAKLETRNNSEATSKGRENKKDYMPGSNRDWSEQTTDDGFRGSNHQYDTQIVCTVDQPLESQEMHNKTPGNSDIKELSRVSSGNMGVLPAGLTFDYNHGLPYITENTINHGLSYPNSNPVNHGLSYHNNAVNNDLLYPSKNPVNKSLPYTADNHVNHGLSYPSDNTANDRQLQAMLGNNSNKANSSILLHKGSTSDVQQKLAFQQRIKYLLATEFPPSEEIDKFEQTSSLPMFSQGQYTSDVERNSGDNPKHGKDRVPIEGHVQHLSDENTSNIETCNANSTYNKFKDESTVITENKKVISDLQFVFHPRTEASVAPDKPYCMPFRKNPKSSSASLPKRGQGDPGSQSSLIINSNLQRLSRKPQLINQQPDTGTHFSQSLAEQLRKTTRKYLENAQQFSRFRCSPRPPNHQLNIGLAKPLLRDRNIKSTSAGEANNMTSEQRRMAKSPWASDLSPPMDLDYDACPSQYTAGSQSEVGQPPLKKRVLSYERIPGRKGQTRLVFQ